MGIVRFFNPVPKPPRLTSAWCMRPNPPRWIAFYGVGEPHLFGGNALASGRASDDLDDERLAALNHTVVKDAIQVDERTP